MIAEPGGLQTQVGRVTASMRNVVKRYGHGRTAFSVGRGAFDADHSLANGRYE